jgi:glyoxylase-like metal-dependent hydrolase (beta-lactamase superfamily II)
VAGRIAERQPALRARAFDRALLADVADQRGKPSPQSRPRPLLRHLKTWLVRPFMLRKLYDEGGEDWFGFAGVRALGDANPDILIIPLQGHTPGHCGVAVRQGEQCNE